MKVRVLVLAVLSAALFVVVPGALDTSRGSARPNTTIPDVFLPVAVTLTDTRISLNRKSGHRGDEVRFTIRNAGKKVHNFTLGNSKRGVGKQVGFSTTLKPNQQKEILLFLDYRGELPYRSVIKADLKKPGMRGVFKIL
jgi:uncharacterized cupredoxin-like copper-binding protein